MKTREEFPEFLNSLGLTGEGAEIGVCEGSFSAHILKIWKGEKLNLIDPWTFQNRLMDASDISQAVHDNAYRTAKEAMGPFKKRAVFIPEFSTRAACAFGESELDFVYIDACHDYRSVVGDLEAWCPKVKNGGVVAGHDYKNSCVRKNLVEVKRAVDNFFRTYEAKVFSTTEDNLPTWYVIKTNSTFA